jgi:hypothetical protein
MILFVVLDTELFHKFFEDGKIRRGRMMTGSLNLWYIVALVTIFFLANFAYKPFPKNHNKLYELLTKENFNKN